MAGSPALPPLLVRADAHATIGVGHVLRSLALAEAWVAHQPEVDLLGRIDSASLRRRVGHAGVRHTEMHDDPGSPADLQSTLAKLGALRAEGPLPPWVLVDGYEFDPEYLARIRGAGFRLILMDDAAALARYPVDLIINQNPGTESLRYPAATETVQLLGSRYVLLRREFRALEPTERVGTMPAQSLLVTMGGADAGNVTATVLEAIDRLPHIELDVQIVVGPANPNSDALRGRVSALGPRVELVEDPPDLPVRMANVDLAVSAAGSTCWEFAYLGTPMIVIEVADNQRVVADGLVSAGAAVNAGWHSDVDPVQLAAEIERLGGDSAARTTLSGNGTRLIDGRGTDRVLAAISMLTGSASASDAEIRPARWEDRYQLWLIANDPTVRESSFHRPEIPLDQHLEWFRETLGRDDRVLLVADVGGAVAAQIRYDAHPDGVADVHFAVAAPFRGRGFGTHLLRATRERACEALHVPAIRAVVLTENTASLRAFHSAGYAKVDEREIRHRPCNIFEFRMEQS